MELRERVGIAHGGRDREAVVDEELDQAVAQDGRVLGDRDAERVGTDHFGPQAPRGRSTVTTVGPPGGLTRLRRPSTVWTRSTRPASPEDNEPVVLSWAPPRPSSRTTTRSQVPCWAQDNEAREAWACWATLARSSAAQK